MVGRDAVGLRDLVDGGEGIRAEREINERPQGVITEGGQSHGRTAGRWRKSSAQGRSGRKNRASFRLSAIRRAALMNRSAISGTNSSAAVASNRSSQLPNKGTAM